MESRLTDYPTTSAGLLKANEGLTHYASAHFLCALRDSFRYLKHKDDTIQGRYYNKRAEREREEAREWFRDGSRACGKSGIGFGFVWDVMSAGGRTMTHPDKFLRLAESLWVKADRDPRFGRKISKQIQQEITGYMRTKRTDLYPVEDLPYGTEGTAVAYDEADP